MTNHLETLKQVLNYSTNQKNVYHQLVSQVLIRKYQKGLQELNYPCGQEIERFNETYKCNTGQSKNKIHKKVCMDANKTK